MDPENEYDELSFVAHTGHVGTAKDLLKKGEVRAKNKLGELSFEAQTGHVGTAKHLVKKGEVGAKDKHEASWKMNSAAGRGYLDAIKRLVKQDISMDPWCISRALLPAAIGGHVDVEKYLVENCGQLDKRYANMSDNDIVKAAAEQNFQEIKRLVECGADINEKNLNETTALHCAAQYGSLEMVQFLVEHNADINSKNCRNETALHYAVKSGSLEVVIYLVEHGAGVNDINSSDRTSLHFAVERDSLEMVKYLVERGAEVTRKGCRACDTVLYFACRLGNALIVDYLLQHQGINDLNKKKRTSPLEVACLGGHTQVVQTLLKYGVNIRQEKILTCGNDEIINILKQELNRSIKHKNKIHELNNLNQEKLTKVGQVLKCCTNEKSLLLGKGCMGTTVYVGVMHDGSEVAVKRMLTQTCEDSARNEIEILNRTDTKKSPFIVNYRRFYHDDNFMYLILDLCEETLKEHVLSQTAEHLKVQGPRMIKEILNGLEFLHRLSILHRDLKPTNVLVDVEDHMKLADFGVSRVLNEDETTVYTDANGTRDWMPVEVIEAINKRQKCRFKKKSDVQVTGMIGFFILTKGDHPHGSSSVERTANILKGDPVNLDLLPNLDARQFLKWLISHNITDRPYASEALSHSFMIQVKEYVAYPQLTKPQ